MKEFEEQLARLDELDDPLAVFDEYFKALQGAKNIDNNAVAKILEKATREFVDDRRYRNDPRYLKLWLAYAKRCREPEDIFAFLALNGIATELAAYYEEYAAHIERRGKSGDSEKALAILQAGVERNAKPLERIKKTLQEFTKCMGGNVKTDKRSNELVDLLSVPWTGGAPQEYPKKPSAKVPRIDVSGYRTDLVHQDSGEYSFEEIRAISWRSHSNILMSRTSHQDVSNNVLSDEDLPCNPDEMTHVSIYKDNTADIRELARALARAEDVQNVEVENSAPISERHCTKPRLSLIPEEPDVATQVSGIAPKRITQLELENIQSFNNVIFAKADPDSCLQKRRAQLAKSIGKEADQTIASLKTALGLFFVEKQLGDNSYLAVDLEADQTDSQALNQVVLKCSDSAWEAEVLSRIAKSTKPRPSFPTVIGSKVGEHSDGFVHLQTYYGHGCLEQLVSTPLHFKLVLFWLRELTLALRHLHSLHIIHGSLDLQHVLVRLGSSPVSPTFDLHGNNGWSDRGIAVVGFARAIDAKIFASTRVELEPSGKSLWSIDASALQALFKKLECDLEGVDSVFARGLHRATWSGIDELYRELLENLEERLQKEAVILPTLKSLLTKLEILLLQR